MSVKTGEIFLEFYSVYDNKLHLITVELKASQTDLSRSPMWSFKLIIKSMKSICHNLTQRVSGIFSECSFVLSMSEVEMAYSEATAGAAATVATCG